MAQWHGYQPTQDPISKQSTPVPTEPMSIPATQPVMNPTLVAPPTSVVSGQITSQSVKSPLPAVMPLVIGVVVFVVLGGGGAFFGMQQVNQAKQNYKDHTAKQIENLSLIQEQYDDVINLINSSVSKPSSSTQSNQVLGIMDTEKELDLDKNFFNRAPKQDENRYKVLGLEDSEAVQSLRKLDDNYNLVLRKVDDITDKNLQLKQLDRNIFTKLFIPSATSVVKTTEEFTIKTKQLIQYQDEMNQISIEAATAGFEWGVALEETIYNNADASSVKKLEEKTNKLMDLKARLERVSTEGLSSDVQAEHKKQLDELDSQLDVFKDVLDAMKQRDIDKLQSAIRALMVETVSSSETDATKRVSFWKNDPTVNSVQDIRKQWVDYQSKLN